MLLGAIFKRFDTIVEFTAFENFCSSYENSLRPSYVLYIGKDKLDSVVEKENIELIKKQMTEAGLEVQLVIFDRYSIREKMKNSELVQNDEDGERGV